LTDINFVTISAESLKTELISSFEHMYGETLKPGDVRHTFLLQILPILLGLKNDINNTGKQNLLRYASGEVLDAMGEFYDCTRIPALKAKVTMQFTLSSTQANAISIPAGTRVTPDGKLYFATMEELVIAAGGTTRAVSAEAMEAGEVYNGYAAGQIKNLVDPIAYVESAVNTNESSGGADEESDDNYRERIRLAPASYSGAGPTGAYEYWAKTADVNIADIKVDSPTAGTVRIVPLMKDGNIPDQAVLDKVLAIVSADKRRPLTDNVVVAAPARIMYNINFTYYIAVENQPKESYIRNQIEGAGGALDQYKLWQSAMLGRAINPDQLRYNIMAAGASRISLTAPAYAALDVDEVAAVGTVTVVYGGLE